MLAKFLNQLRHYKHRFLLKKAIRNYALKNNLSIIKGTVNIINDKKLRKQIYLRKEGSDIDVFNQIFLMDEYQPLIQAIKTHHIEIDTIIDLGANIGLSTIYFNNEFKNAKIYAIEPDNENFRQLNLNIRNKKNISAENVAIWTEKIDLVENSVNPFRDGGNWAKTFIPAHNEIKDSKISGVTVGDLIIKFNLKTIDLLKIDIEGAERYIFVEENNLDFLAQTKVISIEIHDEFNIRSNIYKILKKYGFALFETGELTIGINHHFNSTRELSKITGN
jgi:FkbM family methyltransferase